MLAQPIAARNGVFTTVEESQAELLARLRREGTVPRDVLDVFLDLSRRGKDATHAHQGDHAGQGRAPARSSAGDLLPPHLGDPKFKPGPFQPPRPPAAATAELQAEIACLRAERDATLTSAERVSEAAEARAQSEAADCAVWQTLAAEEQAARSALTAELAALQQTAATAPPAAQQTISLLTFQAAEALDLDEPSTRDRIDAQMRARDLVQRCPRDDQPWSRAERLAYPRRAGRHAWPGPVQVAGRTQRPQREVGDRLCHRSSRISRRSADDGDCQRISFPGSHRCSSRFSNLTFLLRRQRREPQVSWGFAATA